MENVNKTNADRLRAADDVVVGMRVQGQAVVAAVRALLFEGESGRKVTLEELVTLLADALGRSTDAFRTAEAAHMTETSGDVDVRAARDAAILALRENVIAAGHAITGAFGTSVEASMGLDVVWAVRGDLLLGQARNAIALIRKARKLQPLAAGVRIDTGELAARVKPTFRKAVGRRAKPSTEATPSATPAPEAPTSGAAPQGEVVTH